MNRRVRCTHLLGLAMIVPAAAQAPPEEAPPSKPIAQSLEGLSARAAVRKGNTRLLKGYTVAALEAYAHAEKLRPEAPQIPFAQGLAHLAQKDFDAARDAFRAVAASDHERLANDALYSLGASYHLEAMENSENPEQAIEKLESAMTRYREVLASAPNHAAARESDYKAAAMRRQLKQLLEQQQQQQKQDQQGDQEEQEEDQQQSDQERQDGDQQQDQEQQSSDQQQEEGDQQQEQQSGDESKEESEEEKKQQAQKSEEEEISREQAERQLREMMQAIRERQKKRKPNVQKVPLPPVERDW